MRKNMELKQDGVRMEHVTFSVWSWEDLDTFAAWD